MKIALIIITVLILTGVVSFIVLGLKSQSGEAHGLVEDKLSKCPGNPNCVCSEFEADVGHYIEPIVIAAGAASEALSKMKNSVREMGGSIQVENDNYLAATFTSSIFRFVDDLEIRIDSGQKMIHLRSASRVGRSDRGVNRDRIKRLKILYRQAL